MNALQKTLAVLDENQIQFPVATATLDNARGLNIAGERKIELINKSQIDTAKKRFEKQMLECKPDGERFQTSEQIKEELRVESRARKEDARRNAWQLFQLCRPLARDFLVQAAEHLEDVEKGDREQCEEYGVEYRGPSSFVVGCRAALAGLDRVISKLEALPEQHIPIYVKAGDLLPWVKEFQYDVVTVDAYAERMAAKPKIEEAQTPGHLLSPEDQAKRAAAVTAEKAKLRAEGKL